MEKNILVSISIATIIVIIIIIIIVCLLKKKNYKKNIKDIINKNTNIIISNNKNKYYKSKKPILIINNENFFRKIMINGELGFGESYLHRDWDSNNLELLISELMKNENKIKTELKKNSLILALNILKYKIKSKLPNNTIKSSKNNVSHHYDIGNDLYEKMLDKNMQYTCGYFYKPNMNLNEAQYAKMELVAKKLNLKPGMKILDIGCGFGGLAYHLANNYNVFVTGVTLSKEQKKYANNHFNHPNVNIIIQDYRNTNGKYDRVYSIGMFEHVGRKNYKEYFDKCYNLLNKDGIMLLHTIGTNRRKWIHDGFINKYIFPEGELPHIKNLTNEFIDKWHLEDWQNFGLSYAKTLRSWHRNIGNWNGLEKYDDKFRRMWNFYLLGCAATFQTRNIYLWQIVYTKNNSNRNDDCHHIRN